ncbi:arylesterase [Microvirga subterranea]|uniref:Acyl-CoA thioesterase-1 n=1 Tax=Microvirga subterranea TaxID=186651 RepID=A0A370HVD0_9HYPH|nr:arylesterase [Microvirga subterranea]RDI62375.1 acyl-CoA thioesterase-1 [Microvirga subterranea]
MKRQSGPFMTIIFACAAVLAAMVVPAHAPLAQGQPIRLVALGDSLTAGYGLPQEAAFPVVLERALKAKGYNVEVANAGVSGDTASAGLDRLDWSVPDGTDGVIVELGANDMLRGVDPSVPRKAIDGIVERLKARGIPVMLAGMLASRNLGADYAQKFDSLYPDIAKKHDLVLYPFFLDGVAGERSLNLQDGIHPTAKGVEIIVARILPTVEQFIATLSKR